METDDEYRARLFAESCEGWGAFWSIVLEAKGEALDDCGAHLNNPRRRRYGGDG